MSNSLATSSYEHVEVSENHTELPLKSASITNAAMERLLLEAQKESSKSSQISSVMGSPKLEIGTASPALSNDLNHPEYHDMEWVWNWSSRPEVQPRRFDQSAFKHPVNRRHNLSIRNTRLMTKISTVMEFFPYIFLSHACSFIFGASLMALYYKKVDKAPAVLPIK